jgi:hypothetical protein
VRAAALNDAAAASVRAPRSPADLDSSQRARRTRTVTDQTTALGTAGTGDASSAWCGNRRT